MNDQVIDIVGRILNVPAGHLTSDSSPETVAGWDSMKHIEIILALEQEFDVRFDALQLQAQPRITDLCSEIQRLRGGPNSTA